MLTRHIGRLSWINSTRQNNVAHRWFLPLQRYAHQNPETNQSSTSKETGKKLSFKTKFALWTVAGLGTLGYAFYVKYQKEMSELII